MSRTLGSKNKGPSKTIANGGRKPNSTQKILHGHTAQGKVSPTYQSWKNMMTRCTCSSHPEFAQYGGRGVKVLSGWMEFKNFIEDLGLRPKGTTLGRILDTGNYELGNAFWQTRPEQDLARRNRLALLRWISERTNPMA